MACETIVPMYCKSIYKKYAPYVGEVRPQAGCFTWKGYYLSNDRRTYHGISFATDDKFISLDERNRRLNAYLVKREKKAPTLKANNNIWYSSATANWGITYTVAAG